MIFWVKHLRRNSMINNDWERFGEEIRRTIQDAVDNQDFRRLNQTVSDTVGRAMDAVSDGLRNGGWYKGPGEGSASRAENGQQTKDSAAGGFAQGVPRAGAIKSRAKMLYLRGTAPKVGGIFLAATGYVFGVASLLVLFILFLIGMKTGWELGTRIAGGLLGAAAVIFAAMAYKGTGMVCSVGRFRNYVKVLGTREYCNTEELAKKTGRTVKAVVKDLKKMIRKGWFLQGHLDDKGTCLMVSNEAYAQYTALMERMSKEKADKEAAEERQRQEYEKLSPEVQNIVKAGDDYVRKIREANDVIPGEEISAKISRMEMLVDRIFDRVEENPDSVDDIRKLMEYYLPTTIKLLEAYEELDAQPIQGENILSSKREIEKTLDTLNIAFEKLLDDLFQDTAWDVSTDISVLNTMLAQEGLTEDGLKASGNKTDRK